MITSKVTLDGISPERVITVKPSEAKKCERCWQYKGKRRGRQELSDTVLPLRRQSFGTPETRLFA